MNKKIEIKKIVTWGVLICLLLSAFIIMPSSKGVYTYELKTFHSYKEMLNFLKDSYKSVVRNVGDVVYAEKGIGDSAQNIDFSKTNIQVEGVDEPDIVKTDGSYIYLIANRQIFIIKAYPPENSTLMTKILTEKDIYPVNIFINDNLLIVFCDSFKEIKYEEKEYEENISYWQTPATIIKIYNITNKTNPKIVKNIEVDGGYFDSRMINHYVYVITNGQPYIYFPDNEKIIMPEIRVDNETMKVPASHIHYVDMPDAYYTMINVISIDLVEGEVNQKSFLIGSTQSIYVSNNNIFLTCRKHFYSSEGEYYEEKTVIHRISIKGKEIKHEAMGEVFGHVLNQFSMDEYNGYFRIATTTGNVWDGTSSNNVYILDSNLTIVGKIENIAPGERIYSARFIGEKAYLVTFKKVDPFFTLNLSDPYNPKVLGKLKIPGYSDYLHPYDEYHIIGIGKETVEALDTEKEQRYLDFAWYQGIKIALFDVSDFENPKEIAKVVIGDRGTTSPVLYDHKALLFDREKELFVIPISLYEIDDEIKASNYTGSIYGEFTFQGAYVYKLNLENGFEYVGRITHSKDGIPYSHSAYITRALYIEDTLYTISEEMIKMNDLKSLEEINMIELA